MQLKICFAVNTIIISERGDFLEILRRVKAKILKGEIDEEISA